MGDKFQRVQSGQRVAIPAGAWNAMLEAARAHEQSKFNAQADTEPHLAQADICKVLNTTAGPLERFAITEIAGALIAPADNEAEFQVRAAFRVRVPTAEARGRWCVLAEPIPPGRIGRAWVSGVCPARVSVEETHHQYAEADAGNSSRLVSADQGSARILWRESGSGQRWALIRIGVNDPPQLVRFELLNSLLPGTALAELFAMEGHFLGIEPLRDPEGIFASLDEGDRGLAIWQGGQYWAIQAACPKGDK